MHPAIAICMVFAGCCCNVVFLELLIKEYPGSGNLITFAQFLFISLEGFIFTTKFGSLKPNIPIKNYVMMVSAFFVVNVVNNYALNFNIPMPLHMIFRAGSLIANLILGIILLNKSYKISKYFAVIMITTGIAICTLASTKNMALDVRENEVNTFQDFLTWSIGIGMLLFALFMSAWMGIFQETLYQEFGKHPFEALFYSHVLPLPGFLLLSKDIYQQAFLFSQSAAVDIPIFEVAIPKMWLYLLGNIITQFICIQSVFVLTSECSSLTVNLVLTLRKFFSLLFSIFYFNNPFTFWHWIGTILVFTGTFIFIDFVGMALDWREKSVKLKSI